MNTSIADRYRWFRKHGCAHITGRMAEAAIQYARAEEYAAAHDWEARWEDDTIGSDCYGDHKYWCKAAAQNRCEGHAVELCFIVDGDGNEIACLGGIIDPADEYRRMVEAELYEQAIHELARQNHPVAP